MFYILVSAFFLIPVLAGIGSAVERFFGEFCRGISSKLISGIVAVTIFWSVLAFFFPLNITIEIITLIIGFSLFFFQKVYLDFFIFWNKQKFLFPILVIFTAFFGSFSPYIMDHFGYYVPTIKWLSEIGLVRGISNLDLILGQMSFWHFFQSGFSHFVDPFLRMNVLVLVVYLFYIFEKKSWIHLVFLPVFFLFLQQPSPDLPVMVFSLIILNEILNGNKNAMLLTAFSVFVFIIKPTAIWLPMVSFLYALFVLKLKISNFFPAIILLFLFFFKNIWTFGYPIFPAQIVDLGYSWKPNSEILKTSSQLAVEKTFNLEYSFAEIQKFTFSQHLSKWIFLKGIKGKIHLLLIFFLFMFLAFTFFKRNKIVSIISLSIFVKTFIVLVFSAQYRFFLDVFFVIFFVIFFQNFSKKLAWILFSTFTLIIAGILSFPKIIQQHLPSFNLGFAMGGYHIEQLYQPSEYTYKKYKTHQIGNLKFNVVQNYPFSFDTPIPAISPGYLLEYYRAGIFPQLSGKNLKDGFVWRKLSKNENQKLKEIISSLDKKH